MLGVLHSADRESLVDFAEGLFPATNDIGMQWELHYAPSSHKAVRSRRYDTFRPRSHFFLILLHFSVFDQTPHLESMTTG